MQIHLTSKTLPLNVADGGITGVSAYLDQQEWQHISEAPWGISEPRPEVLFSIAHNPNGIYLKYKVSEEHILTRFKNINDPVYLDSCVEFFIAFAGDNAYYNLEFNAAGVALGGYGAGKNDRVVLPLEHLREIEMGRTVPPHDLTAILQHWELTLFLPFELFVYHQITSLSGQVCKVNFYKCGDDLPKPHFLSWAPLNHSYPEFHLPHLFGTAMFV